MRINMVRVLWKAQHPDTKGKQEMLRRGREGTTGKIQGE